MSKCLYTESDVTQSGAQLVINAISLDGETKTKLQKKFKHAFPEAWSMMDQMLNAHKLMENDQLKSSVGDVIWADAGGNRHIGFCIVKENANDEVNKKAIELCIKSAKSKARQLNIEYVGMGLFASESPKEWANIVDIVEKNLEEIQGVVCIPTNDDIVEVLSSLPGPRDFKMIKTN